MNTKELLHAYKLVRQDFIENFRPSMSGGLRIARKNLDWFLMDRVEKLIELDAEQERAREKLMDAE
jgi:hypothetical protein|tara:strand:+ start:115 stop:312 length:198 start_codon:yes stop_codon:yes gene_type:complete